MKKEVKLNEPSELEKIQLKEETNTEDPEAFIRSLQVSYVTDTEVSIKVGNKKAENHTCEAMGFKKKQKLWQLFIKVLQTTDHEYHVGIYSKDKDPIKNKNYYNLAQRLSNFSKQFVSFLNDKYSASLPTKKFTVFENMKGYIPAGTYKPKFHIFDYSDAIRSADVKNMSETETINKIIGLSKQKMSKKDGSEKDQLLQEIMVYAAHAKKMDWITEEQLREMISLPDEAPSGEDAMSLAEEVEDINNF